MSATVIGVISDTHGRLDARAFDLLAAADCRAIIHAGDVGSATIIYKLQTIAPVVAVLGNNDYPSSAVSARIARPTFDGVGFVVAHYPRDVLRAADADDGPTAPRVLIHGHTHVPEITPRTTAGLTQLVFCPGSATLPRQGFPPSVGFITVEAGALQSATVVTLDNTQLL